MSIISSLSQLRIWDFTRRKPLKKNGNLKEVQPEVYFIPHSAKEGNGFK